MSTCPLTVHHRRAQVAGDHPRFFQHSLGTTDLALAIHPLPPLLISTGDEVLDGDSLTVFRTTIPRHTHHSRPYGHAYRGRWRPRAPHLRLKTCEHNDNVYRRRITGECAGWGPSLVDSPKFVRFLSVILSTTFVGPPLHPPPPFSQRLSDSQSLLLARISQSTRIIPI